MSPNTVLSTVPLDRDAATSPAGSSTIAEFPIYLQAQRLVDRLADSGFAVERVRIVGTGLRSVEQVTGRMTKGRAALAGAASGAWLGVLIGLLFALFTVGAAWLAVLVGAVVLGALWGALFGFVAHWATRGRRDFTSVSGLQAEKYAVQVDAEYAAEALRLSER